jgi:hypothetical protein
MNVEICIYAGGQVIFHQTVFMKHPKMMETFTAFVLRKTRQKIGAYTAKVGMFNFNGTVRVPAY